MNLFGKKKKQAAPTLPESIAKLKEAQQTLEKQSNHLEKQMNDCIAKAKQKMKAKDKKGALLQMKRKKMYERQIDQIQGKIVNIETQVIALEGASTTKEVFSAMQVGAGALKETVKANDVDTVADMMDDITEAMQMADEVGEAMSQQIGPIMDEDELMNELEDWEAEMMDEQLLDAPAVEHVAPIAAKPVAAQQQVSQEDQEVDELAALMN